MPAAERYHSHSMACLANESGKMSVIKCCNSFECLGSDPRVVTVSLKLKLTEMMSNKDI